MHKHWLYTIIASAILLPFSGYSQASVTDSIMGNYLYSTALTQFDLDRIATGTIMPAFQKSIDGIVRIPPIHRKFEVSVWVGVDNDGVAAVEFDTVTKRLSDINELFRKIDLSFATCSFNLMEGASNSELEIADSCSNFEKIVSKYYKPNTLNLYVVHNVSSGAMLIRHPDRDTTNDIGFITGAASRKDYAQAFGLFLGLYPTEGYSHLGEINEKSPIASEHVSRDSCFSTGDLLCDTEADPGLGGLIDKNCEYTGYKKMDKSEVYPIDNKGQVYVPTTTNMMSDVSDKCAIMFTNQQLYRMTLVYEAFLTYLQ